MLKTRTRMISFRLSEEEYTRLKDMSLAFCARSVSEFARATLCRMPSTPGTPPESGSGRLDHLESAVLQLSADLRNLRRSVEALRGHNLASSEDKVEARQH